VGELMLKQVSLSVSLAIALSSSNLLAMNEEKGDSCQTCYQKAITGLEAQEGIVCHLNHSHKTTKWHMDPFDKTRYLCKTCYQKAITAMQTHKGRVCHVDPSHKTVQFYRDPFDKAYDLCQSCYKKALTAMQASNGRVCSVDPSHKTIQWRIDPFDNTRDLCDKCYKKALTAMQAHNGRVCHVDPFHKATCWHKDPFDKTRYLCEVCYQKAIAAMHTLNGKVCSIDPSHQANKWYKDPFDNTRDLCRACWLKERSKRPTQEGRVHSNFTFPMRIPEWHEATYDKTGVFSKACSDSLKTQKRKSPESNSEEYFTKRLKESPIEYIDPFRLESSFVENQQSNSYLFDCQSEIIFELDDFSIMNPSLTDISNPFVSISNINGLFTNREPI
jgi:hypothetical protein